MPDENKLVPREDGSNGHIELMPIPNRFVSLDLSPREPHLYDYLLVLRKHQWLILSFLLAVVTIVSLATFRMRPVYVATARIEIDRENANILPFPGADSYDYMVDSDNYIETQAKILTSETLALQTIRNNGLALRPEFGGSGGLSEAVASGNLANQTRPPELAAFLGGLGVRRVPNSRLMDVSFESTDPQAESMKKESLYEFAKAGNLDAVPQVESNIALTDLLKKRGETSADYTDALAQYGPNFPKVMRLKAQLKDLEDNIEKEKQKILDVLESDYREARQRETLMSEALDQAKAETNQMAEKMVEYNILKREAEANKALYEGLMTKMKETAISGALRSSNIRIVDPAMVPTTPARPAKTKNIILSFLVALVGAIGLALLRESLDNTVKTPDDIETLARLPSLAVVPQFAGSNGHKPRRMLPDFSQNGHDKRIELVAQHLPKSQMSEAFRVLRT